jgi:hypothetical protein
MNSRIAWSYERRELEDVRLLSTADFDCSRSGSFRTVFGVFVRLLSAMGRPPVAVAKSMEHPTDLMTNSAFLNTNREGTRI